MKLENNQSGAIHLAAILAVVVAVAIGVVGWKVWDNQKNKKDSNEATPKVSKEDVAKKKEATREEDRMKAPDGWVKYQDKASNVSFYHPSDWEKSKLHVFQVSVSETVKGTNFGPYSAKYVFKKAENKWYQLDMNDKIVESSGYTTTSEFPVSNYPGVYGYTGEGGGSAYYAVFTDGSSSYLIELPKIAELTDPNGLGEQKKAIIELVNTIRLDG